jgi:hypothetical protein
MWRSPIIYLTAAAVTAWFVAAFLIGGALYSIFHPHPISGVVLLFAAIPPTAAGIWITEHLRRRHVHDAPREAFGQRRPGPSR